MKRERDIANLDSYERDFNTVKQALRDQIEDCAKIVDRVAEVQTKLGHLEEASILRTLATTIRAQATPKEEEKPDDNQPDDRFDLEGFECNEKQEVEMPSLNGYSRPTNRSKRF